MIKIEFKQRFIKLLINEYKIFLTLILFFTLISYMGDHSHYLDIISQFRVQYFAISLFFLIAYFFINKLEKQSKWIITTALMVLIINFFEVFPWISIRNENYSDNKYSLKIALSNVHTQNNNYKAVINFIGINKPDIAILQEVDQTWLNKLELLEKSYPYKAIISCEDNFGMALYSKIRLENVKIKYFGQLDTPLILCEIKINGRKVRIAAVHTTPPTNETYFKNRNSEFIELSQWVKSSKIPALVIGDLNTSMFSPSYKRLIADSNLQDTRKGFGIFPTWSVQVPIIFRVPLDSVLYTNNFEILNFKTGNPVGSDHLPVLVNVKLK